jgi:hypothetical protein
MVQVQTLGPAPLFFACKRLDPRFRSISLHRFFVDEQF